MSPCRYARDSMGVLTDNLRDALGESLQIICQRLYGVLTDHLHEALGESIQIICQRFYGSP